MPTLIGSKQPYPQLSSMVSLFLYLDFGGEVIPRLRIEQLGTLCASHASDVFTVTQPMFHTHLSIWSRQPSRKEGESK